jgi:hypothetical protein
MRALLPALAVGLTLILGGPPLSAAARDLVLPEATYPALAARATSAKGFVPAGWVLEAAVDGDLDADGRADLALVLRADDPRNVVTHDGMGTSPFDSNPRILAIAFAERGGGYRLVAENHDLIPRPVEPIHDDPFDGEIAIARGVLRIGLHFFANAGSWETFNADFALRWQNGRFELIGYDRVSVQRNTGEMDELSVNYSTRKVKLGEGSIGDDRLKTRWTTLPFAPLPTLDDIGDGLAFDPGL